VTARVENPSFSKKDAAEYIGIEPNTVYKWDTYVDDALEVARADIHRAALDRRKQAVLKAIAVKIALLDSEDENVRSKVASEIIEWELGKASQGVTVGNADGKPFKTESTNVNIQADNAHDAGNILAELARLGAIPSGTGKNGHDTEVD